MAGDTVITALVLCGLSYFMHVTTWRVNWRYVGFRAMRVRVELMPWSEMQMMAILLNTRKKIYWFERQRSEELLIIETSRLDLDYRIFAVCAFELCLSLSNEPNDQNPYFDCNTAP